MTNTTNIIVLLKRGKKVTSCNNILNDVTERVKCKVNFHQSFSYQQLFQPVNGVGELTLIAKKSCPEPDMSTAIDPPLPHNDAISATSTISSSASSCKCGVKPSSKIVGGEEAKVSLVFTISFRV